MNTPSNSSRRSALGSWEQGRRAPSADVDVVKTAVHQLGRPLFFVEHAGKQAVATGGVAKLGTTARGSALPLLAQVPALLPEHLGDAAFRAAWGTQAAYVVGEMANGIASVELTEAAARAGFLGVFGAAGLPLPKVEAALDRLQKNVAGLPWTINIIHSPDDQALEMGVVDLLLKRGVHAASASAFLDLTLAIVKYRVAGIHTDAAGNVVVPNRLIAKVSRTEVARKFLEPAPERFLTQLVASGFITQAQAALAAKVPMVDDLTAEADSGGHTDNRPLVLLLPALQALRDEVCRTHTYAQRPRIGAAGGIATPASVASAFAMGAAYVVTGSVNQATLEAGTSDAVRQMLAQASSTDVAMAPAADMFEMGVKVQVLTRGTLFAVKATRLYELYRTYDSLDAIPPAVRTELEQKYLRSTFDEAWASTREYFTKVDPTQITRADANPKHKMALVFRSYLGRASHWANDGIADRRIDFQIWCGPAMGAFNEWCKGSFLEKWDNRHAVTIGRNLMVGAAVLTRIAALRTQGISVPADVERFEPRSDAELDALLEMPVLEVEASDTDSAIATVTSSAKSTMNEPIAIVGMGSMLPSAENLQAFWKLLRTGKDAITDIPESHWSLAEYYDADQKAPDKTYAKRGGFLSPYAFDPTEFGIPPSILEATDTSQLLGLVVARMAMEDAGYGDNHPWDRSRASVLLGVTGTQELVITLGSRLGHPRWRKALKDAGLEAAIVDDVVKRISESYVGWQENSFPGLLGNVVAGRIANRLDFGGTNCVIDAACASSLGAVHLGILELRAGRSDLVLTGGVDCLNDIFMHMCFSKTPALSSSGDARPFSDKSDGTLLGEGLGMVVLKRLSDAERDGDRVYATILGMGTSSDGRAKSIYAPLPSGQARALKSAYKESNVRPRDITLLEAHGTGTKAGDAAEFEALNAVYREDSQDPAWVQIGTVKSQIGHTKSAAGAAGLIKAALALHHKVLPPTLKVDAPNPAMKIDSSPFSVSGVSRPWLSHSKKRRAAVSSFGFGGSNFHMVLEEVESKRTVPAWDSSVELLSISSKDLGSFQTAIADAMKVSNENLAKFAMQSREAFRSNDSHRLVAVVTDGTSLSTLLAPALEKLKAPSPASFSTNDGVHVGIGASAGKLAFVFPGQGAQHVDMLRELACIFPEILNAVESDPSIAATVYPLATFDAALKKSREEALTKTNMAQPAIGAVSRGLLEAFRRFGVNPQLTAGHSYGELVALHAAGVLSADGLKAVSQLRGTLMAGDGSDRGTMLAVLSPLADIEKMLSEEKLDLVLANRNGPAQGILSGARAEIDRAETACQKRSLRTARLNVGAAFHSKLVSDAAVAFRKGLNDIEFKSPRISVIADSNAAAYPSDANAIRDELGSQLAKPVLFDAVIEQLYKDGARTFVEVGPKTALTGMVKAILGNRPFAAIAVDAQTRRGGIFDFAQSLARIAAEGHDVKLTEWQKVPAAPRASKVERVRKMNIPLSGVNYRSPWTPMPVKAPNSITAQPKVVTVAAQPTVAAAAPMVADAGVIAVLQAQQQQVNALQTLQDQTARLHHSFLEGQLSLHTRMQSLMLGQPMTAMQMTQSQPLPMLSAAPVQQYAAPVQQYAPAALPAPVAAKPVAYVPPAAAVVTAAPVVAAPVQAAKPVAAVNVSQVLLSVVAESTGYPLETLALSMDMEADLGIDSIKRVEILSAVSKRVPGAPSVNPEKLGSLRTLQQVLDFVGANASSAPVATATPVTVAAPVAAAPSVNAQPILLAVVSELTGYPLETLSLSMDMEADLGIDSIKRVEILSAISKRIPGAPSVNPEKLGSLRTLQQVLDFVGANSTASAAPAMTHSAAPVAAAPSVNAQPILLAVVSELTGYPLETLSLSMDMEADLGIDSIKRVEILSAISKRIPGAPSVNPEKLGSLRTLQQVLDFVGTNSTASAAPAMTHSVAPVAAAPSVNAQPILLAVVSELTGYPLETLSLSMDMEADLGIDSIKRVEILSAISKRIPGAPSVNPEKLGSLRTLQQVLDFVGAGAPAAAPVAAVAQAHTTAGTTLSAGDAKSVLLSVVAELTGYPLETLSLGMDMEADLGIDSIKRVEILSAISRRIPGAPSVNPEKLGSLRTLQQVLEFVTGSMPEPTPPTGGATKTETKSSLTNANGQLSRRVVQPIRLTGASDSIALAAGDIVLAGDLGDLGPALVQHFKNLGRTAHIIQKASEAPAQIGALLLFAPQRQEWTDANEATLKTALHLARDLSAKLRSNKATLATIAMRDGAFGFANSNAPWNPLAGGLSGLAKTMVEEWPEVRSRALDVSQTFTAAEAAHAIVHELNLTGPREVGLGPAGRVTLALVETPVQTFASSLKKGDVVVVTGGARGVTAECAQALAARENVTLVLLGRSAAPVEEPTWLQAAVDEASIKRALMDHAPANERPTPKMLGEAYRSTMASREIRGTLNTMKSLGIRAEYKAVDVRDVAALQKLFDGVRAELGPIRGVIHGAGVLRDKRIEDKKDDDFDQVLDTKIAGLRSLLTATAKDDLHFISLFASVTGRFGRRGQCDYAVANQALVSIAQVESARRQHCRVVALDWGPWEGGMVTPALKAEFEKEGVAMIPLKAGAQAMCDELLTGVSTGAEIVIGAGFGDESVWPKAGDWTLAFSQRLETRHPILADHRLAGKSVLPFALSMEWLAQAAIRAVPGLHFTSMDDVRVLKGITIGATAEDIAVWVGRQEKTANGLRLPVELRSAKDHTHVKAWANFSSTATAAPAPSANLTGLTAFATPMTKVYAEQLFHGPSLEAIESIDGIGESGMTLKLHTQATSERLWLGEQQTWALDPLVVDGIFQALIVWCRAQRGAPSLPSRLTAIHRYARMPKGNVRCVVKIREIEGASVTSDIELIDDNNTLVARIDGYVCTVSNSLDRAFQGNESSIKTVAPSA